MFADDSGLFGFINRLLERVSSNITVEKMITDLGLDPGNLTLGAVWDRAVAFGLENVNAAGLFATLGALFFLLRLLMKTMVPLRVFGIVSAFFFLLHGIFTLQLNNILQNLVALPIESWRLIQMLNLVKKARAAASGDLSMEWLKPFMSKQSYKAGDVLFRKGDKAEEMFFTVTGKFVVREISIEIPPGQMIGELGFLTPDNKRTATIECVEDGDVLTITYELLLEIYFQNPEFGYYFLRLASNRLLQNIARLESIIEENKVKMASGDLKEARAITALDTH